MYVIRWMRNGHTQRLFARDEREPVLRLLIAGQMLGYSVRVEVDRRIDAAVPRR